MEDEIEFTCVQDPTSSFGNPRLSAIRIKHLQEGSVKFETLVESGLDGVVTREAPRSPQKSQERNEGGVIAYNSNGMKKTVMYFLKDCDKNPRVGDNVKFNICQIKRNKELIATNIQDVYVNNYSMVSQVISQPIDLQQLFMHQLHQQQMMPASPILMDTPDLIQLPPPLIPEPLMAMMNPFVNGLVPTVTTTTTTTNGKLILIYLFVIAQ